MATKSDILSGRILYSGLLKSMDINTKTLSQAIAKETSNVLNAKKAVSEVKGVTAKKLFKTFSIEISVLFYKRQCVGRTWELLL